MAARTFASGLAFAVVLAGNAAAQQPETPVQPPAAAPSTAEKPPVAIGGWRYERSLAKVTNGTVVHHQFFCQQPGCGPRSSVSYRIYPPSPPMTMEKFRENQEWTLGELRKQAAPGTQITQLDIKGDGKAVQIPAWFMVRRLTVFPDGTKSYRVSSTLLGRTYSATLISTSPDEKAASDNHTAFLAALMIFINTPRPVVKRV